MNRITTKFEQLKREGRKGFIPFITAGDPDLETSKRIVLTLAELGADVIELGVPFSDPIADGPVIQASSARALNSGTTLAGVLKMVTEVRAGSTVPIVLFGYLNPFYQYRIEHLAADAAAAGIDGILITDVIDEEAAEVSKTLRANGIDLISLVAPTTSDTRLKRIADNGCGFIYAVSRAGVTGTRKDTGSAEALVVRIRKFTDLPVAVGFGISTRAQIEGVWKYADAAVVGSAIVAEIAACTPDEDPVERVQKFMAELMPSV